MMLARGSNEHKAEEAGGGDSQACSGPGGLVSFCLKWSSLFVHITLFKVYIQVAVCSRAAQLGFYRGGATGWTGPVSVELG